MKTFGDLTATSQLENGAIIPANNAANTVTNKITFSDLKGQILNGTVSEVSLSGTTLSVSHEGSNTPTTYTTQDTWTALVGATSEGNGTAGYAPAPPSDGYNTKYLRADGTWATPPDTWTALEGATSSANGTAGYAPAPPSDGYNTKYLRADGTWATPPDNDTWIALEGATSEGNGTAGYAPAPPSNGYNTKYLRADGTWVDPLAGLPDPMVFKGTLGQSGTISTLPAASASGASKNVGFTYKVITDGTYDSKAAKAGDTFVSNGTDWILIPSGDEDTWIALEGATSTANGTAGYAPAPPSDGYNTKYLRADGTWTTPPDNNTWTALVGATSSANGTAGYAPAPPSDGYNTKYLRADGTWAVPPDNDTTYTPAKLGFGYGSCSTAAGTAAKTVSISNYVLTTGGMVAVKFANAVGASATLSVNSTAAKPIYYNGSAITAGIIQAGVTATLVYDGTNFNVIAFNTADITEFDGGDEG